MASKEIQDVSQRLAVGADSSIISKAVSLLSLARSKTSSVPSHFLPTICLDLALSLENKGGFSRVEATRFLSIDMSKYWEYKTAVEKLVGIVNILTLDTLAVQFGCTQVIRLAIDLLEEYKVWFANVEGPATFRKKDWQDPELTKAIFFVMCETLGVKLDSRIISSIGGASKACKKNKIKIGTVMKEWLDTKRVARKTPTSSLRKNTRKTPTSSMRKNLGTSLVENVEMAHSDDEDQLTPTKASASKRVAIEKDTTSSLALKENTVFMDTPVPVEGSVKAAISAPLDTPAKVGAPLTVGTPATEVAKKPRWTTNSTKQVFDH